MSDFETSPLLPDDKRITPEAGRRAARAAGMDLAAGLDRWMVGDHCCLIAALGLARHPASALGAPNWDPRRLLDLPEDYVSGLLDGWECRRGACHAGRPPLYQLGWEDGRNCNDAIEPPWGDGRPAEFIGFSAEMGFPH